MHRYAQTTTNSVVNSIMSKECATIFRLITNTAQSILESQIRSLSCGIPRYMYLVCDSYVAFSFSSQSLHVEVSYF